MSSFLRVPSLSSEAGDVFWSPFKTLWLWGNGGIALYFFEPTLFSLSFTALLTFSTLCLGHSVGLHRGLIHQTYRFSRPMKLFFLTMSSLTGLGSPLTWVHIHAVRDYWQNRMDGPRYLSYEQNLLQDFVWNLHMRFVSKTKEPLLTLPKDLLQDKDLRLFHRLWLPLNFLLAAGLFLLGGWTLLAMAFCGRIFAANIGHWFIGYAVHSWGESRFKMPGARESGTNSLIFGWLAFGEGYHNNHHKYPGSASMGLKPHELDVGYWVICALSKLKLIQDVQLAPELLALNKNNS